jgi:lysyl-tRNA synthetase class II
MEENGKQFIDQKFLELLQSGSIPPSGGFGLGIERLLAASDEADSDVRRFIHAYQHS